MNEIFANQNQAKTFETFQMGNYADLEGSNKKNQQKEKVKELSMRQKQVFSRNSNLRFCDKIEQPIKLNKDAQPFTKVIVVSALIKEKQ